MGEAGELEVEREGAPSPASPDHTRDDDMPIEDSMAEDEEYEPAEAQEGDAGEWTRANKSSEELLDHYSYFYGI